MRLSKDYVYHTYTSLKEDNDRVANGEQAKCDNIILTGSFGFMTVAFAFISYLLKEEKIIRYLPTFWFSVFLDFCSLIALYFSSYCSIEDIKIENKSLGNIWNKQISLIEKDNELRKWRKTIYGKLVSFCNSVARICFIIAFILFFTFAILVINKLNIKENNMDKNVRLNGLEKNKPANGMQFKETISKDKNGAIKNVPSKSIINEGVLRNKPAEAKVSNNGDKNGK